VIRVALVLLVVIVCWVGSVAFRVWSVARVDQTAGTDAIVVLGASQYDGRPSPVFAGRLDQVVKLYEAGVAPTVVTVGSNLPGDRFTEAAAGRDYLIDAGVPATAIVPVPIGNDTWESLIAVKRESRRQGWDKVTLVSDPWHMFRAREMAEDLGLTVRTAPTRTGPIVQERITEVRSIARETAAYVWWRFSGGAPWSGPDIE
jgi:uncharacterized SAM-binding protein YcdF (DUF218 family)